MMELSGWQLFAAAAFSGAVVGVVFWVIARLVLLGANLLPARPAFAEHLLADAGNGERLRHRALGRALAVLLAAVLVGVIVAALCWLLVWRRAMPGVADWMWIVSLVVAGAVLGTAIFFSVQLMRARRQLQFTWATKSAVGSILKRLNLAGNAVFHTVAVENIAIDHVVVGRKGVFALNVVARRAPRDVDGNKPAAELKNGKLWLAGHVEALPVGDAARNMTLLSGALSKLIGHRVPVRSVLVVPGWRTLPTGEGNHLVLSEKNLAMLTSWNTPDAHLMDEDCATIHAFLYKASRVMRLS